MKRTGRRRAEGGYRWIFAAWLIAVAGAHAADEAEAPEARVPGMEAQRIDEPVFGGQVVVYEAGRGNAPGILLVHGIGSEGARDFREQIDWMKKSFHVIALDLPGFGQSDKANVLYSPGNYAAVLRHVAGRFLDRPFLLVGHSMGAVVSLRYAATYPEDVERLVVADAPGVLHRHTLAGQYLAHVGLPFVPSAIDPAEGLARLARKLLSPLERLPFDPEVILASPQLRQRLLSGDPVKIAGLAVVNEDLRRTLPRVVAETLVVWGADDTIAPLRTGKLLALKLPHARLAVIDQAGHELMLEAPERFRAVVEPFLELGLPPAPAAPPKRLRHGDVFCKGKRAVSYEGDYDTLTLDGCEQISIRNARVRELRVLDSSVTLYDSRIGGGKVGVDARSSTIEMTGGRIEGDVAISALASRLDLAAVEVEGREAAVTAGEKRSYVVFSLCRVRSPHTRGEQHGFYTVTEKNPL